ncbi:hypothetical protein ACQ27_gp401 [Klebsiella phage K64-1]|nr:hypothetical protein ACQ27_gp401 [Klebsiella phage K64-1]
MPLSPFIKSHPVGYICNYSVLNSSIHQLFQI